MEVFMVMCGMHTQRHKFGTQSPGRREATLAIRVCPLQCLHQENLPLAESGAFIPLWPFNSADLTQKAQISNWGRSTN